MLLRCILSMFAFASATLAVTVVVNLKLEGRRAGFWSKVLRGVTSTGCILLFGLQIYSAQLLKTLPHSVPEVFGAVCLFGLIFMCAFFLATDYLQYRKQKDAPQAMQTVLRAGHSTIVAVIAFSIVVLLFMLLPAPTI